MPKYKIADVTVEMSPRFEETIPWYEMYRTDDLQNTQIKLSASDEKIQYFVENGLDFTPATAENRAFSDRFYVELLRFDGGHLHSSAVLYKDRVYLFSASSGVGKSTLTRRIINACGDAVIINDDKPAFRIVDGKCIIYGTPFAGGTAIHQNRCAELGAIVFIERSDKALLTKASSTYAITNILQQTTRVIEERYSSYLFELLSQIIEKYPIYSLKCPNDDTPVIPLLEMMNQ